MSKYEEEFYKLLPRVTRICNFFLLGKKLIVEGSENFVKEGGNIIVGNHIGSYKDVSTIFKIIPRLVFFTANREIFTRHDFNWLVKRHLVRHMGKIGAFINFLINPIKFLFVDYISSNIEKVGSIPVDMGWKKSLAIQKCQEYVKKGRSIITLQGRGRIQAEHPNPYIYPFRRGPSIIAYNVYKETGLKIPVTPIAMFGTHYAWVVPAKIRVRVSEPMYVTDYLEDDMAATIERFRAALEAKVTSMILDIIRNR
jgi:1-acyl-sn-glycerol-3-phosphate acyltransferase